MKPVVVFSKRLKRSIFLSIKKISFEFPLTFEEALGADPDILIIDETQRPGSTPVSGTVKILLVGEGRRDAALRSIREWPGFSGFLSPDIEPRLLAKALRAAREGELWITREVISLIHEEFSREIKKRDYREELLKIFSGREKEVLGLMSKGYCNKDIARDLFISEKTVKSHLYNIYRKLDVNSRAEAIFMLFR